MAVSVLILAPALASCAASPSEENSGEDSAGSAETADAGKQDPAQLFESSFAKGFEQAAANSEMTASHQRSYTFTRSLQAQKRNVDDFIASRRKSNQSGSEITAFLASGDALADVHREMERLELNPSDASDTLAMLYASIWQVVNNTLLSTQDAASLRITAGETLARNPHMDDANDLDKQRAADSYALLTAVLRRDAARFRDHASVIERHDFREAIRHGWKQQSGIDMRQTRITSDGLVPR